jgi:hypothetical protein
VILRASAIESLQLAIAEAERLLGQELIADCADRTTGEIVPLTIVTDNGPAFKSLDFLRFFARRSELRHVRTRHHAPETGSSSDSISRSSTSTSPRARSATSSTTRVGSRS